MLLDHGEVERYDPRECTIPLNLEQYSGLTLWHVPFIRYYA